MTKDGKSLRSLVDLEGFEPARPLPCHPSKINQLQTVVTENTRLSSFDLDPVWAQF